MQTYEYMPTVYEYKTIVYAIVIVLNNASILLF